MFSSFFIRLVTFCDMIWEEIERKRRMNRQSKLIYETIVQSRMNTVRFRWHLAYTLVRNDYLKFVRKNAQKNLNQLSSFIVNSEPITNSTLVYERSPYRYRFDGEQNSDLRLIYQQLKSLTNNISQMRSQTKNEQIYLSPRSPLIDDRFRLSSTRFSQMATIHRR